MRAAIEKNQEPGLYPSLAQLSGSGKGRVYYIDQNRITIGRAETNHVVVVDDSVSREHAIIEKGEDGAFVIFDNQSRNGILVNGKKVDGSVIESNDEVSIGKVIFRFTVPGSDLGSPDSDNGTEKAPALPDKPKLAISRRTLLYGGAGLVLAAFFLMNQGSDSKPESNIAKKNEQNTKPQVIVSELPTAPTVTSPERPEMIDLTKNPVEKSLDQLSQGDSPV
ncbi:MAG: FHA domain-containing protein, partial [Pseudomonadota bacterium]